MHFHKDIFALFIFRSGLVLAQQSCYWPNGSGLRPTQGNWVNCYSSQASTCCANGDVCLSNGLCYQSMVDMVYRGGCTVKDWSNSTACPTQWCNDVETDTWSSIWHCPPLNNGGQSWWCGYEAETTACQTGINASFVSYTGGSVLGFPPLTPSPSASSKSSSNPVTSTFSGGPISKASTVTASSLASTATGSPGPTQTQGQSIRLPTGSPVPAQTQAQSTSLPTAIGVGIGVPLGIATVGFIGFLFWKEAVRQHRRASRKPSQEIGLNNGGQSVAATIDGRWPELPDAQLPRELDGRGRTELDGRGRTELSSI